ncbi:ZIP family metal transporter [Flavobacterium sp.]|uniref:ZIP family metal transporter n=1 Tax=Flavobacterium sp. TaxID=239 RepID=UPI003529A2C8
MQYIITFSAVILGFFIALFLKPQKKKNIKLLLAFSGAFLLSLTVLHLLPELFEDAHHVHDGEYVDSIIPVGVFIMIGILFQIVLEFFSKGAEHGHVHVHTDENNEVHQIPWLLFISLCIHALLEGFPIHENTNLAYGIAVHHFPIAIILTLFFVNAKMNKWMVFAFMFAFALMTPLGTLLAEQLHFAQHYSKEISAIVVGILFHISSTIIFESNEDHKFNLAKITMIVLGFLLAFLMEMGHSH